MKNKRIFKTFSALCAALVLMMGLSVTAFAQGTDQPPAEDTTNDANVVVEETEDSPALTPDGNAALVDDFGGNKQLITVTTKAGNYPHTVSYAKEHGELEAYRASLRTNYKCKEAIEAAVREHFDGMYLSHDAAKGVIQTYGIDRVMLVLANTVQLQDWDGRYSRRNKEWAKTIPNYNSDSVRGGYAVNSHPAVLNGFIDLVREEQQRSCTKDEKAGPPRTSVREKLKKELPAVNRSTVPKKGEPER